MSVEVAFLTGEVDSLGVWNAYPPPVNGDAELRRLWRSRVPLGGAVVPAGQSINFILHLKGEPGVASGPLVVDYTDSSGATGTWTSDVTYRIKRRC